MYPCIFSTDIVLTPSILLALDWIISLWNLMMLWSLFIFMTTENWDLWGSSKIAKCFQFRSKIYKHSYQSLLYHNLIVLIFRFWYHLYLNSPTNKPNIYQLSLATFCIINDFNFLKRSQWIWQNLKHQFTNGFFHKEDLEPVRDKSTRALRNLLLVVFEKLIVLWPAVTEMEIKSRIMGNSCQKT